MKNNWATIATVALTAVTSLLVAAGILSADESTSLATSGSAAVTGIASFATAIVTVVKAHKAAKG